MPKKKKQDAVIEEEILHEDKGAKVKGEDAVRDSNSGAIVFNNQSAYQQAVRRKRQGMTNKKNDGEIRTLQKQVAQLTSLVEQMINSK